MYLCLQNTRLLLHLLITCVHLLRQVAQVAMPTRLLLIKSESRSRLLHFEHLQRQHDLLLREHQALQFLTLLGEGGAELFFY
jgi:hypothetical protein